MTKLVFSIIAGIVGMISACAEVKADMDCSLLDPRVSISSEKEGKVQASAKTLFKIAKAGGSIEGRLKQDIQNLQRGVPISEKGQIELRTLYLFCGMVANSKDISIERKVSLFKTMTNNTASKPHKIHNESKDRTEKQAANSINTKQHESPPASISQSMDNSPGGLQIGQVKGQLTINQAPQPRHLSQPQKDLLYSRFKAAKGSTVHVIKLGDREAGNYADEIISLLSASGIKVELSTIGIMGPPQYGVFLWGRPTSLSSTIEKAFRDAGVVFSTNSDLGEDLSRADVNILVGLMP